MTLVTQLFPKKSTKADADNNVNPNNYIFWEYLDKGQGIQGFIFKAGPIASLVTRVTQLFPKKREKVDADNNIKSIQ